MITQVPQRAGRFISQHTAPNIPHLPASTPSSLSPCSSPKPWPKPSDCTLGLVCVCPCLCVCVRVFTRICLWMPSRDHAPAAAVLADGYLCHCYNMMMLLLQMHGQELSALNMFVCLHSYLRRWSELWPVCVWSRVEQRRLCSGLACLCLEGRG